jgi:hypothetical protein
MRRAVVYLRVSTIEQTTANQERELREIAGRMGCEIVKVYKDHGISGTHEVSCVSTKPIATLEPRYVDASACRDHRDYERKSRICGTC